ncbi:MAG: TolC family protein [Nitrospirae bacterium]|nr:TolC family protein [Nitrospirota bacterium]
MKQRLFVPVMIVMLGMGVGTARAEPLTLRQLYGRAIEHSEDLQISVESVRQSEQEERRAISTVFPQLTLSGDYTRYPEKTRDLGTSTTILQPREGYGAEARVEQSLYAGGKNSAGRRIAQQETVTAEKDVRLAREKLLLHVAEVFYTVLRAQKTAEIQARNVERLKEHRRLSELRYKVGEVTESILLRAEAELAGANAELVARERDVAVAKRELGLLAGLTGEVEIVEPPAPRVPEEPMTQLREAAQSNREEIQRSRVQERIAEERIAFARGNFLPSVKLEGSVSSRRQDPQATFFIEQNWFVGGKIEFPIFEGGLRVAEWRQAKSRYEQGRLETGKLSKQIDLDVTRAGLTLEAVTRALDSRRDQLRFAQKNYEMVSKQFTFGLATNLDALDANQALIEAERDVIAATYDRHLAILDLQRSAGVFLAEALKETPAGS